MIDRVAHAAEPDAQLVERLDFESIRLTSRLVIRWLAGSYLELPVK